ncbi:hypothetical protein [Alienimonas chondri]|uniref:MarR family transcriptional regulator n=1 Tax=Alienimonas chondri TaxID=2681879 RepID=A0ABX1VJ49_9PLAN|nr:hypothetical protein [Alienimonas chondri]NNJ28168.1 hypothetical protein [Alienimonas chondri]
MGTVTSIPPPLRSAPATSTDAAAAATLLRVVRLVPKGGQTTRGQIAARLGWSVGKVDRIARDLVASGLIAVRPTIYSGRTYRAAPPGAARSVRPADDAADLVQIVARYSMPDRAASIQKIAAAAGREKTAVRAELVALAAAGKLRRIEPATSRSTVRFALP